ncbi:MAG: hypothetical protein AB7T63_00540 [Planctomycetota bacterium]
MRILAGCLVALALAACGEPPLYVVEIQPTTDGMERTVGFVDRPELLGDLDLARDPLPHALLEQTPSEDHVLSARLRDRLRAAYGEPGFGGRWRNTFGKRSPGVLDGFGHIVRDVSPLGSVAHYVERFGGTDDPEAQQIARTVALDAWLALIRPHWLKAVEHHPGRERLVAWMEHDLAREAAAWFALRRQLSDALWSEASGSRDSARLALDAHLAERGCHADAVVEDPLAIVRAFTRRELGLAPSEPLPAALERGALLDAVLKDASGESGAVLPPPTLPDDLGPYARPSSTADTPEEAAREERLAAYARLAALLEPRRSQLSGGLDVCVFLRVPHPPVGTDGIYDTERRVITWFRRVLPPPGPCAWVRASWPEPDAAMQTQLWGAVHLTGGHLHDFVRAWQDLDTGHRARGMELLERLRGDLGGNARGQIAKQLELAIGSDGDLRGIAAALANGLFDPGD